MRSPTPTWTPSSRCSTLRLGSPRGCRTGSTRLFLDSLAGQEIAGDTLAERAPRGDAVAVLTAHRAKGLEWDLVVVAGVQEGSWPDLRQRGSLLGMDELVDVVAGRDGGEIRSGSRGGGGDDGAGCWPRSAGCSM